MCNTPSRLGRIRPRRHVSRFCALKCAIDCAQHRPAIPPQHAWRWKRFTRSWRAVQLSRRPPRPPEKQHIAPCFSGTLHEYSLSVAMVCKIMRSSHAVAPRLARFTVPATPTMSAERRVRMPRRSLTCDGLIVLGSGSIADAPTRHLPDLANGAASLHRSKAQSMRPSVGPRAIA